MATKTERNWSSGKCTKNRTELLISETWSLLYCNSDIVMCSGQGCVRQAPIPLMVECCMFDDHKQEFAESGLYFIFSFLWSLQRPYCFYELLNCFVQFLTLIIKIYLYKTQAMNCHIWYPAATRFPYFCWKFCKYLL